MSQLFVAVLRRRLLVPLVAIVVLAVAITVTRDRTRSTPAPVAIPTPDPLAAPAVAPDRAPPPPLGTTPAGRIVSVDQGFYCGHAIGVSRIRYRTPDGRGFGLVVPCIEFRYSQGLRFHVGDEHTLSVDRKGRVASITWHGRTWDMEPTSGLPSVIAPDAALDHLGWTYSASGMSYQARGWRWPRR